MRKITTLCLLLFCCCFLKASAQGLKPIITAIDGFHQRQPIEKLYLHTDKPYYAIGDTLRFKAYLLDESLSASLKSGIMYVELINDSSRVCKRQTIMLSKGRTWGDIVIKKTWYPGNYTMRAYTNWMRNFGEEHFFTKQISIMPNNNQQWLVNEQLTIDKDKKVNVSLHFSDFNHKNIGFRDMQLSVLAETKIALTVKERTDADGNLSTTFSIPEKLADKQFTLLAEDISKEGSGQKTTIPMRFNRPENIDLQFMPEGGNMIAGIKTKIGFKAIGEDGKGRDISGKVYDSKQQEVSTFKSTHLGMGNFELTPQPGESYTAKIDMHDGTVKSYALQVVNPIGIALRAEIENDSLKITLTAPDSPDSYRDRDATATAAYYLIGEARDKVCYAAKIIFRDKEVYKEIAKSIFPAGIVKWVLLDEKNHPVSQRMVFIDHNDLLKININSNKENYLSRDSVGLQLAVMDKDGNPVQGHFSLAVTDDNQVKTPGADAENLASYMLLNPDLKGTIEEPGYYFNKEHADREAALDNLLLTQGWAGYDWKPVFEPPVLPKYEAETQFTVKGRVSDIFNLPIPNTHVLLVSVKPPLFMDTATARHGRFVFSGFPIMDTISFHLQPTRTFNVGIDVDEFVPPEFTPLKSPDMPWYMSSDSIRMNYMNNKAVENDELFNAGKSKLLKTVTINDTKIKPPTPFVKLNEEDIRNARTGEKPLNLFKLFERYIKSGLRIKSLIVDGIPMEKPEYWLYQYHTEDIKSFSITKIKTTVGIMLVINIISNTGKGGPQSGIYGYSYRPMPISWPHKFYSPKYTVKDIVIIKDRRSTIFWAPDIVTDATGKAEVFFYSADTPGSYTAIVQGSDMSGNVGYQDKKIKVNLNAITAK